MPFLSREDCGLASAEVEAGGGGLAPGLLPWGDLANSAIRSSTVSNSFPRFKDADHVGNLPKDDRLLPALAAEVRAETTLNLQLWPLKLQIDPASDGGEGDLPRWV